MSGNTVAPWQHRSCFSFLKRQISNPDLTQLLDVVSLTVDIQRSSWMCEGHLHLLHSQLQHVKERLSPAYVGFPPGRPVPMFTYTRYRLWRFYLIFT